MSMFIDRTSLKRTKHSFQSTSLHTVQSRTIPKPTHNPTSTCTSTLWNHSTVKTRMRVQQLKQTESKGRVQIKSTISQIAINVMEEERKVGTQGGGKFMRHFYYRGLCRVVKGALVDVPHIMAKLYRQEHIKRQGPLSPPVTTTHNYLPQLNCIYYSIQNKLILIKAQDLLSHNPLTDTLPHTVYEVKSQVINVIELPKNNVLFQGCQFVIGVVYLWEMEFYQWREGDRVKNICGSGDRQIDGNGGGGLRSLNYIYKFPVERVKSLACAEDGRIFYFDNKGILYQITPQQQTRLLFLKTGKYTLKNYLNKSPNTLQLLNKKTGKLAPLLNLASNLYQLSKYLLSSTIEAEIVFCDWGRQMVFALLRKEIGMVFGRDLQVFVVGYCVRNGVRLVGRVSQEWLVQKYLQHSPANQPSKHSQIHSISPAPSHHPANLTITTKSGLKLLTQLQPTQSRIIEIIRPPDHQLFNTLSTLQLNINNTTPYANQFVPKQGSQYVVLSTLDEDGRVVGSMGVGMGVDVVTYVGERSCFGGGVDVNFRVNLVDLDIYRMGSWKVNIHKLTNPISTYPTSTYPTSTYPASSPYPQLCSQTTSPPCQYLLQSPQKLQLLTYARPIDLLYTTVTWVHRQRWQQRINPKFQLINPEKVLMHLFVNQGMQFSIVGVAGIGFVDLCVMLLQIVIEEGEGKGNRMGKGDGGFVYCDGAIEEIQSVWKQIAADLNKNDDKNKPYIQQSREPRKTQQIKRTKQQQKSAQIRQQCKQMLQTLWQSQPETCPTTQKLSTILSYSSKLLQKIWQTPINKIPQKLASCLLHKFQQLLKYLNDSQDLRVYDQGEGGSGKGGIDVNREVQQVLQTVGCVVQLLGIVVELPVWGLEVRFCEGLVGGVELEECMFQAIRRQFKYYVINLWRNMFPYYISTQFTKLIILYGQLQQITDRQEVLTILQSQPYIPNYPHYFIRYLHQSHKLQIEQISMAMKKNINMGYQRGGEDDGEGMGRGILGMGMGNQRIYEEGKDYQFVVPKVLKEIVDKYRQVSGELSQSDLQIIINIMLDKEDKKQLTITNKQSLLTYLQTNLPSHPKLSYLSKCITTQYQLYRYYLQQLQPQQSQQSQRQSLLSHLLPSHKPQPTALKYNEETMELLRYRCIVDVEHLRKLVWVTADYWLMGEFLVGFGNVPDLAALFKRVCEEYQGHNASKYSSFTAYIEKYVLNFAIKSKFDDEVLEMICQVVDQYLQSLPKTRTTIREWITFSLPTITTKLILLPKLLLKTGYTPQKILQIYLQHLQQIFNKNIPLQNQTLYGIKFLTCYTLIDAYLPSQRGQFSRIVDMQLGYLEEGQVTEKIRVGLKKMIDMLGRRGE